MARRQEREVLRSIENALDGALEHLESAKTHSDDLANSPYLQATIREIATATARAMNDARFYAETSS